MAEFVEIGGKKIDKKKLLIVGGAGAAILGLLYMFTQKSDGDTATTYDGITGYPEVDTTDSSADSTTAAEFDTLAEQMEDYRDQQQQQINAQTDYITTVVDKINSDIAWATTVEPATVTTDRQYNAAVTAITNPVTIPDYNSTDFQTQINNAILGGASAATIDNLNAARNAKIASTGRNAAASNANFDKNFDYSTLISAARSTGASQSVIDNLTAMRNAKVASVYGGVDPGNTSVRTSGSSSSGSSGYNYSGSGNSGNTSHTAATVSSNTYDKNTDYSLAIVNARNSGASQSTINALNNARDAKIDAVYGGKDPGKGGRK